MEIQRQTTSGGATYRIFADETAYGNIYTIEIAICTDMADGTTYWDRAQGTPITCDKCKITNIFNNIILNNGILRG